MSEAIETEEQAAAREIFKSCFREPDAKLVPQAGGLSNYVFEAATSHGRLILRVGPVEKRSRVFARESRAIKRAAEAGVPVPEVVGQGEFGAWAYIVAHRVDGEPATDHPKRADIFRQLAHLAATRIHRIPTSGFGSDFSFGAAADDGRGWRRWLEGEFKAADRLERLSMHGVIDDEQRQGLGETLEAVAAWSESPVLNHGDLRLKNVLVDSNGKINALIDWESCLSAIGPHWDLSIALHDLSIDQKEAFIEGYGLSAETVREFAPVWRLFNALNYAPELERILEAGDEVALDRLRTRFSGSLDLYAEPDCPT